MSINLKSCNKYGAVHISDINDVPMPRLSLCNVCFEWREVKKHKELQNKCISVNTFIYFYPVWKIYAELYDCESDATTISQLYRKQGHDRGQSEPKCSL